LLFQEFFLKIKHELIRVNSQPVTQLKKIYHYKKKRWDENTQMIKTKNRFIGILAEKRKKTKKRKGKEKAAKFQ
jgi:hypothetical protein